MTKIVYPGSFDPITNGHIDVVKRLKKHFDQVTVLIASSGQKKTLFTIEERKKLIESLFSKDKKVTVDVWSGLLVDYLEKNKLHLMCKGLRSMKDFEYEMDMAYTNQTLSPTMETFFVLTRPNLSHVSSSLVKEVVSHGGDVSKFVPELVYKALKSKVKS